jgi:transcriptional regulator with XRE-family HTH domain
MAANSSDPGNLLAEIQGRFNELIEAQGLTQREVADRIEVNEATLSRWIRTRNKGLLDLGRLGRLAKALEVPVGRLLPFAIEANGRKYWDPKADRASRLLEIIKTHDERSSVSSAIYTTLPVRLLGPELDALTRRNTSLEFGTYAPIVEANKEAIRADAHRNYDAGIAGFRRLTFSPEESVRRLIRGEGEFRGRTLKSAREFLYRLRTFDVPERGYLILFYSQAMISTELCLALNYLTGISVYGKTLSQRRIRDGRSELVFDSIEVARDNSWCKQVKDRIGRNAQPRMIIERIKRFEDELEEWAKSHPDDR